MAKQKPVRVNLSTKADEILATMREEIPVAYRQDVLDALPAVQETEHVRHIRLSAPLTIKVDGCKKEAVVLSTLNNNN